MIQRYLDPVAYDTDELMLSWVGQDGLTIEISDVTVFPQGGSGGANAIHFDAVGAPTNGYYELTFDSQGTWFIGFRFSIPSWPNTSLSILALYDSSDTTSPQIDLRVGNDGRLRAYRGGVILQTSTYTVPIDTFIYIEAGNVINSSGGSVEIRVNESEKILYSGNTSYTGNNYADIISFNGAVVGQLIHDINIRDGSDSVIEWWGDTPVIALPPIDDSTPIGFIGSDGNSDGNYSFVANIPHLDNEYVYSNTNAAQDFYEFRDLEYVTIRGIADVILASADQCVVGIHPLARPGYTYQYPIRSLVATQKYVVTQIQNSPETNSSWTVGELNGSTFGQQSVIGSSIAGLVFFDANKNGTYDPNTDSPLQFIELKLYLDNGDLIFNPNTDTLIATTQTDVNGYYGFTELTNGANYWVYFTPNNVYIPSTSNPIGPIELGADCAAAADLGLKTAAWATIVMVSTYIRGVYRTENFSGPNGSQADWYEMNDGFDATALANDQLRVRAFIGDPVTPGTIQYALVTTNTTDAIWRCTNGTWVELLDEDQAASIVVAGGGYGSYAFPMLGAHLAVSADPPYLSIAVSGDFSPGGNGSAHHIYSTDGGDNWLYGGFIRAIAPTPNIRVMRGQIGLDGYVVIPAISYASTAAVSQAVSISTDEGATFTTKSTPIHMWGYIVTDVNPTRTVLFDPQDPDIMYIVFRSGSAPNSGIYRSVDGGNNWSLILSNASGNIIPGSVWGLQRYVSAGVTKLKTLRYDTATTDFKLLEADQDGSTPLTWAETDTQGLNQTAVRWGIAILTESDPDKLIAFNQQGAGVFVTDISQPDPGPILTWVDRSGAGATALPIDADGIGDIVIDYTST